MELKQINEILRDIESIRTKRNLLENTTVNPNFSSTESGSDTKLETYKIDNSELIIQLRFETDSYGNNEFIAGIQFVKPIEKIITSFESI